MNKMFNIPTNGKNTFSHVCNII